MNLTNKNEWEVDIKVIYKMNNKKIMRNLLSVLI